MWTNPTPEEYNELKRELEFEKKLRKQADKLVDFLIKKEVEKIDELLVLDRLEEMEAEAHALKENITELINQFE